MRAFAITFSDFTNLASTEHLCRRVFAYSRGKPGCLTSVDTPARGAPPTPSSSIPITTPPSTFARESSTRGASPSSSTTTMVQEPSTPSTSTLMAPCPVAKLEGLHQLLHHQALQHLQRWTLFIGPSYYSTSTSTNIYFHYYYYINHNFVMRTTKRAGRAIRGPTTSDMKTLCPVLTRRP
jgi:hypothetical protein